MKKRFIAPAVALASIVMAMVSCSPSGGKGGKSSDTSVSTSDAPVSSGSSSSAASSSDAPVSSGSSSSAASSSEDPIDAPIATGAHQYVDASYAERKKILGRLEKYLTDNVVSGLPLYSDSGYQIFNPRVVKGTNTYVKGYGFSTLRDGKLNGKLSGETNEKYQNYYHNWSSSDPQTLNIWNSQDSVVPNFAGNCMSSLFGTKLNAEKNGYEWYGVLSKDDHASPVNDEDDTIITDSPTAEELHTTWRFHVRTGEAGGVKYHTSSTKDDRKDFDGRYIQKEDYLTPFKMMLNAANGLYRGSELAKMTGKGAIYGASAYYSRTKNASKGILDDSAVDFSNLVGVSVGTDEGGDYLQIKYSIPVNRFYAIYSISDSLYQPLPAEFVTAVGVDNIFGFNSDKSYTPVDNTLSVGPYTIDTWESDKLITFKRNADWYECVNDNVYQIEGIHTDILTGYETDEDVAVKEFLNNKLDACGITDNYLSTLSTDPRTVQIPGGSSWKLNINSCTAERWEAIFGENGIHSQTTKDKYWNVKPWMSNNNFLRGLFYSIDRKAYAEKQGASPCINFFGDDYLSNPETGEVYNDTQEHKDAIKDFWGDTVETNGYNLAVSESYFEDAIKDLIKSGDIKEDTTEIQINIYWMYANQIETDGNLIGGYIKKAFDAAAENLGYPVRLTVVQEAGGAKWYDVYYSRILVGQFDLAFGSISGNALDPINYLEIFKPTSNFCLCYGPDTAEVVEGENALVYDGKRWSYEGLWGAANTGIVLDENGQETAPVTVTVSSVKATADTISVEGRIEVKDYDGLVIDLSCINCTSNSDYTDYFEIYTNGEWAGNADAVDAISWDLETGDFSFTLTDDIAANLIAAGSFYQFAVDYEMTIDGVYGGSTSAYTSVSIPAAAATSSVAD
jgi:hypothetical protein